MRTCIYLVNENPFYMLMVANSIKMLRTYNSSIPIRVLIIENINTRTSFDKISNMDRAIFEKLCDKNNVEIWVRPHYEIKDDPNFFFTNKIYFSEFPEEEILFIDGDTFISNDIEPLFAKYDADFVGCENRWMGNDWANHQYMEIKPFNGGILMCKNHLHKTLFKQLPSICEELQSENTTLAKWIQNGRLHNREEFGISALVERNKIKHEYFNKEDAYNILMLEELRDIKKSTIFHCYARQWLQAYKIVFYNNRRRWTDRY